MNKLLRELKPKIREIFEYLHEHPEISWQEYETTAYIETILKEIGCKYTRFEDCPGIVGEMGEGDVTVAVRADLDALWQEVDGEFKANHSCGHDAHMTMVLGTMYLLNEMKDKLNGKVKFLFQPAEEKGTGALKLVEKGVADYVDYLYGVHLRPALEMPLGKASPSIVHGSAQFLKGKITSEDLHGARPHLGANAIEVAAAFVNMLNNIHINPMIPYSAKMTQIQAGGDSANIIPGNASFSLDLRAQTNEAMTELHDRVQKIAETLALNYSVKIELEQTAMIAAAVVSEEAQDIMAQAIVDAIGKENLTVPSVTTGGDDFHFYTLKRPNIKATMLGLGCD